MIYKLILFIFILISFFCLCAYRIIIEGRVVACFFNNTYGSVVRSRLGFFTFCRSAVIVLFGMSNPTPHRLPFHPLPLWGHLYPILDLCSEDHVANQQRRKFVQFDMLEGVKLRDCFIRFEKEWLSKFDGR